MCVFKGTRELLGLPAIPYTMRWQYMDFAICGLSLNKKETQHKFLENVPDKYEL